jgi:hypothetical protein
MKGALLEKHKTMQVWLKSVNNEGHFTWKPKQFFICISPSIAEM